MRPTAHWRNEPGAWPGTNLDVVPSVSDAQRVQAMRLFAERIKLIVEPTGCVGFAAACEARALTRSQRVSVIISGGTRTCPGLVNCWLASPCRGGQPF